MKRTPIKRKGKRMFPQSEEDKLYWVWFKEERRACDVCGRWPASCAHLLKRSQGGKDRNNLAYLCTDRANWDTGKPMRGCHTRQEGRVDAFIKEVGVDLWHIARQYTEEFDQEEGLRLIHVQ